MKAASCCRTPNLNRHKAVFPSVFFISEGLVAKTVVGYAVFMHYLPVPFSFLLKKQRRARIGFYAALLFLRSLYDNLI
jgi:hypothetical protein